MIKRVKHLYITVAFKLEISISYHKVKFFVFEAITDIEVSELFGASLVIEHESGPHNRADGDNFLIGIAASLKGPKAAGLIIGN